MDLNTESEGLRSEIAELSNHPNSRRYSPLLRQRVVAWAVRRVAAGTSIASLCREIGIGEPTLHKFLGKPARRAAKKSAGFKRVKVVAPTAVVERAVVMRGPCGTAVEGLSVEGIADVFKRLACSV
jgi:transposase-like protein